MLMGTHYFRNILFESVVAVYALAIKLNFYKYN